MWKVFHPEIGHGDDIWRRRGANGSTLPFEDRLENGTTIPTHRAPMTENKAKAPVNDLERGREDDAGL